VYRLYPRLIQELALCLSRTLQVDPIQAAELLTIICREVASDQELVEDVFRGLVRDSRKNNLRLLTELGQACTSGQPEAVELAVQRWLRHEDRLRGMLDQGLEILVPRGLPKPDQDQEPGGSNRLRSHHD
jgi:hypothetical protein